MFPGRVRCTLLRLAEISGQVVDADDRPISGVRIATVQIGRPRAAGHSAVN